MNFESIGLDNFVQYTLKKFSFLSTDSINIIEISLILSTLRTHYYTHVESKKTDAIVAMRSMFHCTYDELVITN